MRKWIFVIGLALPYFAITTTADAATSYIFQTYNYNHVAINFDLDSSIENNGYHDYAGSGSYAWDPSPYVEAYYKPGGVGGTTIHLRWYAQNTLGATWYARTYHYGPGRIYFASGDFNSKSEILPIYYSTYDEVIIVPNQFNTLTSSKKYETTTHEMGHVLGLHHEDNTTDTTVMYTTAWLGSSTPTPWDFSKISLLYK